MGPGVNFLTIVSGGDISGGDMSGGDMCGHNSSPPEATRVFTPKNKKPSQKTYTKSMRHTVGHNPVKFLM